MYNVYPFVKNPARLESLSSYEGYILREKANNGEKLSRTEKEWITRAIKDCGHTKYSVAHMGWMFCFKDVLKRFVYKQYGSWREAYACNKTYLRKITYGRIDEIVEIA